MRPVLPAGAGRRFPSWRQRVRSTPRRVRDPVPATRLDARQAIARSRANRRCIPRPSALSHPALYAERRRPGGDAVPVGQSPVTPRAGAPWRPPCSTSSFETPPCPTDGGASTSRSRTAASPSSGPGSRHRPARPCISTGGSSPRPSVDPHFHLDSTLSAGRPRVNRSGTLLEGIEIWGDLAPTLTADDVKRRARELCHWSIARGCLAIRSHVDVTDDSLMAVDALIELRRELAPWIDLQLVAFPPERLLPIPELA